MIIALTSIIATAIAGMLLTYSYDKRSSLVKRFVEGAFIGWALWGIIGFVFASINGVLTVTIVILATYCVLFPPALYVYLCQRRAIIHDIRSLWRTVWNGRKHVKQYLGSILFYIFIIIGLWLSLYGGAYSHNEGIYTRYVDNYADFTLHAGIITGFVYGNNFPPEHPDYAGSRLTYPFIADFIAAMLVVSGVPLLQAMFIQSFIAMVFFVFLLDIWVRRITKSGFAAKAAMLLVLLNGGLGWVMVFTEFAKSGMGLKEYLLYLPHDYTSFEESIRWVNSVAFWFVTMRSMFIGIPLFIIVTNILWDVCSLKPLHKKMDWKQWITRPSQEKIYMVIGAGCIAALLPLVHTHSFLTLIIVSTLLFFLFQEIVLGVIFLTVALTVSFPQLLWLTSDSAISMKEYIGFIFGWNQHEKNILYFWFINTGIFIPLLIIALWKRSIVSLKLFIFYSPFVLCFIIPNFVKLAPWEWDNMKVLAYWYIFSTIPVALLLDYLWKKQFVFKALSLLLLFFMIFAGGLDNWRAWTKAGEVAIYDKPTLTLAEYIRKELPPRSRIVTALIHNNAVLMSGRQSYYGYPGRVWTHGLPWVPRQDEVVMIYTGGEGTADLLKKMHIDYVFVGPAEVGWADTQKITLNEDFFKQYPLLNEVEGTKIYHVAEPIAR